MAANSETTVPEPVATLAWRRRAVRGALRLVCLFCFAYLLVLLLMVFLERWLVYPAPPVARGDWNPAGMDFQDVWFTADDGTRLHGWFLPRPGAAHAVVYCHGNGEHVADNAQLMEFLRDRLEASVLIFDYRGYGNSDGKPHEAGLILDGLAAQRWLADRMQLRPDEVLLMGRSIGGAVALAMAAEQGAGALVLENTFCRLTDTAAQHFPWLPVRWLMRNRYDGLARIRRYDGPLFQSHGKDDRIVPIELGRQLFEAAPSSQKQFFPIPGRGHNDPQPVEYYDRLAEFIKQVTPAASPATSSKSEQSEAARSNASYSERESRL